VLTTHDETTAGLHGLLIGIEVRVSGDLNEVGEVSLILGVNVDEGQGRGGLLADNLTKTGLTLNDDVWDTLLAAESGEPHNKLDGLDIVSDDDQLSLLLLDETGDVLEAILDDVGLLGLTLATSLILGSSEQTSLLLGRSLGSVAVQELEEEGSGILVQGLGELVDHGGNLQTLEQDSALALDADVAGPLDKAGQVALVLQVATDAENAGTGLSKRDGLLLSSLLTSGTLLDGGGGGRGRGDLLAWLGLLRARLQIRSRQVNNKSTMKQINRERKRTGGKSGETEPEKGRKNGAGCLHSSEPKMWIPQATYYRNCRAIDVNWVSGQSHTRSKRGDRQMESSGSNKGQDREMERHFTFTKYGIGLTDHSAVIQWHWNG
jgi:hypothetical protein